MANANPTFSESWYRVADLRPRLRATVRTHRQHFRGGTWHVVQDPTNNSFFRLHPAAYRFVAMLDGRRTVSSAWRVCIERLGDEAVTQNEAIQVLGQLYAANLLQADLPPDAEGLFQRYRKRRGREVVGHITSFLFIRIPLLDPDRLLNALVGVVGAAFTPAGFVVWLAVVAAGAFLAFGSWRELTGQTEALLNAGYLARNLPLMYGAFVLAKVLHELGHGFACKKFGRRERGGGEVHAMGVMFLVFLPMPYVDASSAWMLRSKLRRIIVSAAGMMTELALAAVAAVVWVWTADAAEPWQRGLHAAAFGLMFIAGVATLVFNANFLLRFDGYYILSDLLEIPNLSSRSRQYIAQVVKRLAWGARQVLNPAQSAGEAAWLAAYGVAATAFRIYICVKILLMLTERFFFVGVLLAAAAAVMWVLVPLGKFVHYLLASPELARVRGRALAVTALLVGAAAAGLGLVRTP
ncbi:MAG: peptidase M50, partial [Phycisphaerae bacterium]